jgi:hypothetical protein
MAPRRRVSTPKGLSLLKNKWVLYSLSFVAICQLIVYGMEEKWESTILFVAIGLLAHNYTKNMIVVLVVAIFGAGIFSHFIKINEGMTHKNSKSDEDADDDEMEDDEMEDDEMEEDFTSSHVDKATTIKKNLDNIKNIVGSGGINKMTRETAALMKQQNKMLENMEKLKPLTEQASGLVDKLEGSQLLKTMAQNKGKFQRASEQLSSLKNLA